MDSFLRAMEKFLDVDWVDVKPYYQIDHGHCWAQGESPACGQTLEWHEVCCLCALPYKRRLQK